MPKETILTSEHYNMLKPREIREQLRGKIDPAIGAVLVRLAEDGRETRMQVVAMGKMIDGVLDQINAIIHIAGAMKAQHEARFGPLTPPSRGAGVQSADSRLNEIGGGQKDGG